jgi:pimeloyl-ACP methyl ester carboxylesterase
VLILVEVAEKSAEIDGLRTVWLEGTPTPGDPGRAAIVYLHGNPVGFWIWEPFLTRTGGVAPDLPGFGRTAKPESFDYSLSGYADFLERSPRSWDSSGSLWSSTTSGRSPGSYSPSESRSGSSGS